MYSFEILLYGNEKDFILKRNYSNGCCVQQEDNFLNHNKYVSVSMCMSVFTFNMHEINSLTN